MTDAGLPSTTHQAGQEPRQSWFRALVAAVGILVTVAMLAGGVILWHHQQAQLHDIDGTHSKWEAVTLSSEQLLTKGLGAEMVAKLKKQLARVKARLLTTEVRAQSSPQMLPSIQS